MAAEQLWVLVPGVPGLVVGLLVFAVLWLIAYYAVGQGPFEMEPRGPGSFEPHLRNYVEIAKLIISLAVGSIVLLAGTGLFRGAGLLPWVFASPLVLLALSVVFSVVFMSLLVHGYESFLHEHPHTRFRYSLHVALGFSALLCFSVGYLWLAFRLVQR